VKQYSMKSSQLTTWLGGIAVGAIAMYLSDPAQGKRRRLLMQEKIRTATERSGTTLSKAMRGTGSHLSATQSRAKNLLQKQPFSDESIAAHASQIATKLSGLRDAIEVKAEHGSITLSGGAALAVKEKNRLIQKIQRIPGVREVRDHLGTRTGSRMGAFLNAKLQRTRHAASEAAANGVNSTARAMGSAARRLPVGPLLTIAGLGYAIQSLGRSKLIYSETNKAATQKKALHLQKSIEIQASPETVFNVWSKYDNFPQFMSHVVDVQSGGAQRAHWVMQGPAGIDLELDTVMTKCMAPTMLAWRTEPGAPIEHNGSVRFESLNGGTRATVRMFYNPSSGRNDDIVITLLGSDPEQKLEEDLHRMKNFIEGKGFAREMPHAPATSGQVLH
jgi:uncharacterized membrane protein/osmotically-inducible protein OsmY